MPTRSTSAAPGALRRFLAALRLDVSRLTDVRIWLLLALSLPFLGWALSSATFVVLAAVATVALAAALGIAVRKWVAPDISRYYQAALAHPLAAAIVYAAALALIGVVILAVALLARA